MARQQARPVGSPMTSDWSRTRVRAVMGDAAETCAAMATGIEAIRVGRELEEQRLRSANVLRWAEDVFRAWADDDQVKIAQLEASDLQLARKVLETAMTGARR